MSDRLGTLMYIPHENSNVKALRLSRRAALGLCTIGAGLSLVLTGIALLALFGFGGGSGNGVAGIWFGDTQWFGGGQENVQLRGELAHMEGQVAVLGQKLETLLEREEELRLVADLPPVPVEVQAVGVGGPGHSILIDDGAILADDEGFLTDDEAEAEEVLDDRLESVSTSLAMLLRRSELVAGSMDDVRKAIAAKKDRFEATPSIWPASGFLSSTFSHHRRHPIFHDVRPHYGIDISSRRGSPVVATAAGKVMKAGWENGHGNVVLLDHGHGLRTTYSHASRVLVKPGQRVERGDAIALVGSTGFSVAPHVHYEVHENGRPVDPLRYIFPDAIAD